MSTTPSPDSDLTIHTDGIKAGEQIGSEAEKRETRIPRDRDSKGVKARHELLARHHKSVDFLSGKKQLEDPIHLKKNIENFIGMAQIPVGLAGPMRVLGSQTTGEYFVPLATTEGALVASYDRGMKATLLSGGITSMVIKKGVQRCPFFQFEDIRTVRRFVAWMETQRTVLEQITTKVSRFAQLSEVRSLIEGNSVIMTFEYTTGDAAGQNMVTFCTHAICQYVLETFDTAPTKWYIESNHSGDKKMSALSLASVRGKRVTAECVIPKAVVESVLKTTPEQFASFWQSTTLGIMQTGGMGTQGHVANGLTALYIACGQDVACIAESAMGVCRAQLTPEGDLYAALTLPSLTVGTIGGGTGLPTQNECLEMMDCAGLGNADKFAEICCAVALCGELSIAAAMIEDHFASAHQKLGRGV